MTNYYYAYGLSNDRLLVCLKNFIIVSGRNKILAMFLALPIQETTLFILDLE